MKLMRSAPPERQIGFCYYPDTNHYRQNDLAVWLPRLRTLGAAWLVLRAPSQYAIPESFIAGLVAAGIEPVLQFNLSPTAALTNHDLPLLFEAYARWNVHYIVPFDRPNLRASWLPAAWAQPELVERFLDCYIYLANAALERGLRPVFPALEPGGDYWDTAFLRSALQGMQRRCSETFLDALTLGAYAWTYGKPLNWGIGGPERWPEARPYLTDPQVQDQRGARIFDWYQAITHAVLGETRPVLLLAAGHRADSPICQPTFPLDPEQHAVQNLALARLARTAKVLAFNFWLLAADSHSPYAAEAWFQEGGTSLPVTAALSRWVAGVEKRPSRPDPPWVASTQPDSKSIAIPHYLLLPEGQHHLTDVQMALLHPGTRVTLVGKRQTFSEATISQLLKSGCQVEWMREDGTILATKIAQGEENYPGPKEFSHSASTEQSTYEPVK